MTTTPPTPALDALRLFDLIMDRYPEEPVGNRALKDAMTWAQRGHYQRARDTLIACGALHVIPGGQGGRLELTQGRRTKRPNLGQLAAATERDLYPHLVPHLSHVLRTGDWSTHGQNVPEENVAVTVTGHAGKATSTRYGRPDLTGVVRRPFTRFDALEVHAFEVKGYWLADRAGIYESVAQRAMGMCTHAWLVVYVPCDKVLGTKQRTACEKLRGRLGDLEREAADLGIGFIEIAGFDDDTRTVHKSPKRVAADPERLDAYLRQACPDLLSRIDIHANEAISI